eukprot:gnl/Carplike_NY0171/18374_a28706_94.p1 GENE.gnl/Carplike_NY0171/18374_a28706_94~~gnl/Carplike_NY0171/18374_a28706_94.p1  ORF type:complete len:349 (+),score=58.23 gnl/Carplike_NY0171/18374_a28706_94:23-1048(+)
MKLEIDKSRSEKLANDSVRSKCAAVERMAELDIFMNKISLYLDMLIDRVQKYRAGKRILQDLGPKPLMPIVHSMLEDPRKPFTIIDNTQSENELVLTKHKDIQEPQIQPAIQIDASESTEGQESHPDPKLIGLKPSQCIDPTLLPQPPKSASAIVAEEAQSLHPIHAIEGMEYVNQGSVRSSPFLSAHPRVAGVEMGRAGRADLYSEKSSDVLEGISLRDLEPSIHRQREREPSSHESVGKNSNRSESADSKPLTGVVMQSPSPHGQFSTFTTSMLQAAMSPPNPKETKSEELLQKHKSRRISLRETPITPTRDEQDLGSDLPGIPQPQEPLEQHGTCSIV